MATIRLDENDWGELLQGKTVKLGRKILQVRPYTIAELAALKGQLAGVRDALEKEGIALAQIGEGKSLSRLFDYVASNAPALIEKACGLDREDVPRLPVAAGVALVTAIIDVNIESQEGLNEALAYLGKLLAR